MENWLCNYSYTMGAISGVGTAYPSEAPSSPSVLVEFVLFNLLYIFCVDCCLSFCPFVLFFWPVYCLSPSYYLFGIFKLFLMMIG